MYRAFSQGLADPLPALAFQYVDYAAWQRQWLQGETLQTQVDFWRQHLSGAPALLELPTDHRRPPLRSYAGGRVSLALSPALTAGLRQLGQRHGATLFMTLLAGWSSLLSRFSGQDDVVIGTPVANRPRSELESLIGFFVNTLALRIRPQGGLSVAALLEQVKAVMLAAHAHQDLPFEQVVEALQPPRSLGHSPIFQVMLALNNTPGGGEFSLPELSLEPLQASHTTAQFDLSLALVEADGGLVGSLEYASDLFERATIERMAGHLQVLLEGMVADDQQAVAELPLLSCEQRRQVLESFNDTAAAYPADKLLHQLFEEQAAQQPDALAVVDETASLTYGELNARANRLAHYLIGLGIQPDDRVAICAQRSLEMVVGLLGILKAGGAYVPLDPGYPSERLRYMLEDSAPVAVLVQGETRTLLGELAVPTLDLQDGEWEVEAEHNPAVPAITPQHLAYVIYTSGSTGKPKGVANQHDGVVNRLWWAKSEYRIGADDRVLQKTPFGFDVSVWEIFLPLLAGAQLVMARPGGHQDPHYLMEVIERRSISMLHFVPSMLQAFVNQTPAGRCSTLKRVLCSGEALPHALLLQGQAHFPKSELHNLYGPTEAAIDVTAWHYVAEQDIGIVPIGRPIANTQIYLLDAHGQPVPIGVSGEIHIGGIGVARGYLNRPELTAERFLEDPFSTEPAARMYRSGDLGRWLADGNIEYLGRNDDQVKLRGYRIELGEIESQLAGCPGVREAVVLAREHRPGDKRLVAYLTAQEGAVLSATQLREQLSQGLAEYMIPSAFVTLARFPLTPNGKLDRRALPAPEDDAYASRGYEAPVGEIEHALAEIWQALLGLERVGRHDHFFELGGHSLMAVQLVSCLRQRFEVEVALGDLFMHPTICELAASCHSGLSKALHPNLTTIRKEGAQHPLFLIHEGSGDIGYAQQLAKQIPSDIPVYGFSASGLQSGEEHLTTIEAMASRYIEGIRHIQPQGPYRVAGWSAGGTIAYEIAHQLIGAGATVEFLGLIDTTSDYRHLFDAQEGGYAHLDERPDFDEIEALLRLLPPDVRQGPVRHLAAARDFEALLAYTQVQGLLPEGIESDLAKRYLALIRSIGLALYRYMPPALPVRVTLFSAMGENRSDISIGWEALMPKEQLQVISIMGTHHSIVKEPDIRELGRAILESVTNKGRASQTRLPLETV
ncbi:non-ribosomal peptide synthetase [Pseudomonas syringae]|uniref:non-ribosomal peptide synthetase n=1 Tax=Pseudomonas syringae TaxID=317 RepID=UPI00200AB214|nr:amino acid adenylation domain-containing protein [Pseudomonas syringae]MCK9738895.1 amino acid adenylation domain-containing protein [Pseudomonas syringae pv. syringae]